VKSEEVLMSDSFCDDIDYVRRREAQERAAAKRAPTLEARRAHQEMAQRFAELTFGPAPPCESRD
jgi:hypothetical protein